MVRLTGYKEAVMQMLDLLIWLVAYVLGSLPFSQIIAKRVAGVDLWRVGEGNIGARNLLHMTNNPWGFMAAFLDVGKGTAAYLIALSYAPTGWGLYGASFAALAGHMFPIWLGFRGGKGLAVVCGYLLLLMPGPVLLGGAVFAIAYWVTRGFNRSATAGLVTVIFSPRLFGLPARDTFLALGLLIGVGLKKALDLPRERRVWDEHPWSETDAQPGFISPPAPTNAAVTEEKRPVG